MLRSALRLTVAAAAIASSIPAPSQHQFRDQGQILVLGKPKDFLQHFVEKMAQAGPTAQLARWNLEVCPTILGIDPAEARFMRDRIIELGESIGLRRPDPGCTSSLWIVVTNDAPGYVRDLVHLHPITLRTDGVGPLRRFEQSTRPVRWITVTDECGFGCALPGSRLVQATAPAFVDMIIVIDAKQIASFKIGELSDYVAVVALSNPSPDGSSSQSILSMFDMPRDQGKPFELSGYDREFLTGLYDSSVTKSAKVEQQSIRSEIKKSTH